MVTSHGPTPVEKSRDRTGNQPPSPIIPKTLGGKGPASEHGKNGRPEGALRGWNSICGQRSTQRGACRLIRDLPPNASMFANPKPHLALSGPRASSRESDFLEWRSRHGQKDRGPFGRNLLGGRDDRGASRAVTGRDRTLDRAVLRGVAAADPKRGRLIGSCSGGGCRARENGDWARPKRADGVASSSPSPSSLVASPPPPPPSSSLVASPPPSSPLLLVAFPLITARSKT